jgi:hypothetical protein
VSLKKIPGLDAMCGRIRNTSNTSRRGGWRLAPLRAGRRYRSHPHAAMRLLLLLLLRTILLASSGGGIMMASSEEATLSRRVHDHATAKAATAGTAAKGAAAAASTAAVWEPAGAGGPEIHAIALRGGRGWLPRLGLGCASNVREQHVHEALKVGYRCFDTAQSPQWGYDEAAIPCVATAVQGNWNTNLVGHDSNADGCRWVR